MLGLIAAIRAAAPPPPVVPPKDAAADAVVPLTAAETLDRQLQRFRERVAAAIALLVIAGVVALMIVAVIQVESAQFERIKDLLLFVNPLLGVVIGYYFNKVSTEARAETAETAASTAMAAAQREAVARQAAAAEAEESWQRMQEARATLAEVADAAEEMLAQPGPALPGTLGVEEPRQAGIETRLALEAALRRARRIIE